MKSLINSSIAACALLGAVVSANATVNYFPNGDFDSPAGAAGDWVEVPDGGVAFTYPTTGGNPAGYGIMDATTAGWGIWVGGATTPVSLASLGLTAGQTYTFVQDMKIESGTSLGGLKIESWDATHVLSDSGDMRPTSPGSGSWATYSFTYTVHPAATGLKIVPLWGPSSVVGFDNLGVSLPDASPVAVSITSPTNNQVVYNNFTFSAAATVYPGTVTNVSFYVDDALLGSDSTSPFSYAATALSTGAHTLKAVAMDASGNAATSGVINITVTTAEPPAFSAYEPFAYALGTFAPGTAATGSGLTGGWIVPANNNASIVAGLSYPSLPTANNALQQINNGSGRSFVNFSSPLSSGTKYVSFLVKSSGDSGGNWVGTYLKGDNATSLFAGFIAGYNGIQNHFSLGSVNSVSTAPSGGTPLGNTTPVGNTNVHLIVLKIDFNTSGANDIVSLWIDPLAGTNSPSAAPNSTISSYDVGSISGIGLNMQGGNPYFIIDEIRAGNTFADVVGANLSPTIPTTVDLSIANSKQISWTANSTSFYQPQKSTDNSNWADLGTLITGSTVTSVYDNEPVSFYRVLETGSVITEQTMDGAFDFDDGMGGAFYWTGVGSQPPTRTTADFHNGPACLSIYVTNTAGTPNISEIQQNLLSAGANPVIAGNTYTFSFWAKQNGAGISYVQNYKVAWLDADSAIVGAIGWTAFTGGNETWKQITSGSVVAPAGAVNALIQIFGGTGAVSNDFGGVLIDDVSLATTTSSGSATVLTPTVHSGAVFTAIVKAGGVTATAASGTVTFKTNSVGLSAGTLVNGSASSTPATMPESYIVSATYSGDGTYFGSTASLSVGNAVNPVPSALMSSISGNQLTLSWPADRTGWTLQSQTNGLDKGLSTTWFDVSGSTATHEMTFSIDKTKPTVFYRLKYTP